MVNKNTQHLTTGTTYTDVAWNLFPDASFITGNGQYALIACGHSMSVHLYRAKEMATVQKRRLDEFGCGADCEGQSTHTVIDLEPYKGSPYEEDR